MGKRGPRPTPLKILELNDSRIAKYGRQDDIENPAKAAGMPEKPEWLEEYKSAVECWDRIVPQLEEMGVIGEIDANALGRYCYCWSQWHSVRTSIGKTGRTLPVKDENGKVTGLKRNPLSYEEKDLLAELRRFEQEFGMTASARSRLPIQKKPEKEQSAEDRFLA